MNRKQGAELINDLWGKKRKVTNALLKEQYVAGLKTKAEYIKLASSSDVYNVVRVLKKCRNK